MDGVLEIKDKHLIKYYGNEKIINIPQGISHIDSYAFHAIDVQRIILPKTVHHISKRAFASCGSLKEIVLPDSLKFIDAQMLFKCNQVRCIYTNVGTLGESYAKENQIYNVPLECMDQTWHIKNGEVLKCFSTEKEIKIPIGVTSIGFKAFAHNKYLEKIKIPIEVNRIKTKAFINCSSLRYVEIPDSVIELGACAFQNCYKLESIDLPSKLEYIAGFCFLECKSLKSISIPENCFIQGGVFLNCKSLRRVYIPKSVNEFKPNVFQGCSKKLVFVVEKDSYAYEYAMKYGFNVELIE